MTTIHTINSTIQNLSSIPTFSIFDSNSVQSTLYNTRILVDFNNKKNQQMMVMDYPTYPLKKHRIELYQLILLLDHCARSQGLMGKFDNAVKNAQEIINYVPEWSIGYLRLGELYTIQGKQAKAIQIYDEASMKIKVLLKQQQQQEEEDDNDTVVTYQQFVKLKKTAMKKNEICFDLIALLPIELGGSIFSLLPEIEKPICFNVSTTWRKRMMAMGMTVWKNIFNDKGDNNSRQGQCSKEGSVIANALPFIADQVQNLTIDTRSDKIWKRYMHYLKTGQFKRIQSLKLEELPFRYYYNNAKTNTTKMLLDAFLPLKMTLTSLDIRFETHNTLLRITDLLLCFPNLTKLRIHYLASVEPECLVYINESLEQQSHQNLVDLEWKTYSFVLDGLAWFLKYCPNIRRLSITSTKEEGQPKTLKGIMQYCPKLELFGYNTPCRTTLEQLDYEKQKEKHCAYLHENMNNNDEPYGMIREIFTPSIGFGVLADGFMELIRHNAKSLKKLHANMSRTSSQQYINVFFISNFPNDDDDDDNGVENGTPTARRMTYYPDWHFEQLEQLTYHSDIYRTTEAPFLKSIQSCKALQKLKVVDILNISALVDVLIHLPTTLEELCIADLTITKNHDGAADSALIRLFNTYANKNNDNDFSTTTLLLPTKKFTREDMKELTSFGFDYCNCITDNVLDSIVRLKTIKKARFSGTCSIPSYQALGDFLNNMNKQLVEVTLIDIEYVNDQMINLLGNMELLETIHLEKLANISEQAYRNLVDNAKSLCHLTLILEYDLSNDAVAYIKRKVKSAKIILIE